MKPSQQKLKLIRILHLGNNIWQNDLIARIIWQLATFKHHVMESSHLAVRFFFFIFMKVVLFGSGLLH